MRSDIIRTYKTVHGWTGIVAGLALFIAFYAGAFTVFKAPIRDWLAPPTSARLTPLEDTPSLIDAARARHPQLTRSFTVHIAPNPDIPARLSWQAPSGDEEDPRDARHFAASFDESGQLAVHEIHASGLPEFIDTLHRVVGLPLDTDATRWLMGVIAVLYSLALVSGLIILLPSLVKDFFAFRVSHNLKRMWLDAHNLVGIISFPFHLVMALTAATFAFHDGIYQVQNQVWHGNRMAAAPSAPRAGEPGALRSPLQLLAIARQIAPDLTVDALEYQGIGSARPLVRIWGHDDRAVMPRAQGGFLALDPFTGRLISRDFLPGRQTAASAAISSFFALHMASFGGIAIRWMYFLLAMAGAWLFYSGNLLWIESRRKKAARTAGGLPEQRRDVQFMAALTVGSTLGCALGLSLALAVTKALSLHAPDTRLYLPVYYLSFFAAIVWAFRRKAADAAIDLLWGCTLATLGIALASLGVNAASGQLGHGWAVDLAALIGSGLWYGLLRISRRRMTRGASDTVWRSHTRQARPLPDTGESGASDLPPRH